MGTCAEVVRLMCMAPSWPTSQAPAGECGSVAMDGRGVEGADLRQLHRAWRHCGCTAGKEQTTELDRSTVHSLTLAQYFDNRICDKRKRTFNSIIEYSIIVYHPYILVNFDVNINHFRA